MRKINFTKLNNNIKYIGLIFILILFTAVSCKHIPPPKPSCTKLFSEQVVMKWGTYITKTGEFHGYKINTKPELIREWYDTIKKKTIEKSIDYVDSVKYCNCISHFKNLIMKYQILNIPADTVNYLEYDDPSINMTVKFIWNPNNKTYANEEAANFVEELDELAKNYDK
jgi:hypothetical protein